jgi:hypothetical protein
VRALFSDVDLSTLMRLLIEHDMSDETFARAYRTARAFTPRPIRRSTHSCAVGNAHPDWPPKRGAGAIAEMSDERQAPLSSSRAYPAARCAPHIVAPICQGTNSASP